MLKVMYYDISNDLANVIGLFYEVREDVVKSEHNHEIQTYVLIYQGGEINFRKYALYTMNFTDPIEELKIKLSQQGYINLKEWCHINKKRLIGNEDVLTLIKSKQKGL